MNRKHTLALVILLAAGVSAGRAQKPPGHGPAPHGPVPAPLLYVRFSGPPGLRVTFYTGAPAGHELPAPVTVGLRPGYIYRMKVTGFPDRPGVALYPSLEVRGTLQLPPQLRPADYPAPVVFSGRDVERVAVGAYLTKVVYVEHAEPVRELPLVPEAPLEVELRPELDPLAEARTLGRPMFLLRFGGRDVPEEELAAQAVPGTILLPGETGLGPPAARPYMPWACLPLFDPRLGPRLEDECLHDGGDVGLPVGLDAEGRLHGLDPSDTVAVYTDHSGGRHIAVSNRVCICVPRFAVLVSEILPSGYLALRSVEAAAAAVARGEVEMRLPSLETRQVALPAALRLRERPSIAEASIGTLITAQLQVPATIRGRMKEAAVVGVAVKQARPPEKPLVLCKTVDREGAQIGDVVTFSLRYTNQGGLPITDVVISDSLAGRLEYVPGSARSDRPAVFTMQENEAGSLILRWEVGSPLLPGQSGVVSFQTRIR